VCLNVGKLGSDSFTLNVRKTVVIPEPVDGKIFLVMPFLSFNFDFYGTKLYTSLTSDKSRAASAMVTCDVNDFSHLSAQAIDPTIDHRARGIAMLPNDQVAVSEITGFDSGYVFKTRIFDYVRCDDGTIFFENRTCVCPDLGGEGCPGRSAPGPSPSPSPASSPASSPSSIPSATSSQTASTSSSHGHPEQSLNSETPEGQPLIAYILIGVTALFLVAAIVFIILFFVSK